MKAVIMQVRGKKSIVLFSNGKFGTIPTPPGCEEGSVVTIYVNKRLKLLAIILAAAVLLALGVFIGVSITKGKAAAAPPSAHEMPQDSGHGRHGRMMERRWW
ncbi:MAG: anti-sigma factor domain-containing protein [Spirochaetaceae bacterium]|jgi:hypothetical protein|nr:anti-sigma factor domain-containing protein [Spirochaetaceae bacterium]